MIHNAYLGLVIFYIGPLRKEICAQSIPSGPTSGYAGARDIYVHMHRCATMVIFIMINPAILLWSRTYYFSSHLINMLNPIYIYVRSITWVTWQVYSLGVDMYMYTLMLHGKRVWMPKRRSWRHFQHTTYFRFLYILLSILSSHFTLFYYILILPNG